LLTLLLVGLAGWKYWPVLLELSERWWVDPQYSHCAIVPPAALFIAWVRRHSRPAGRSSFSGLVVVSAGLGLNYFGQIGFFGFLQALSIIVVLAGIVLTVNGWKTLAWAMPPLLLLAFAVPLPFRIHSALGEPLQKAVALGATYLLQLQGRPAAAMGNVVVVDAHRVSVVDACCGLGMLFVFLFVAGVIACLSRRPIVDKLVVFAAAPVAGLLANVLRVAATIEAGLLGYNVDFVAKVHDIGGYLLAPTALVMMLFVAWVVALVFPTLKPADEPLQIAFQLGVSDHADFVAPSRRPSDKSQGRSPLRDARASDR
jgi:exosortase